MSEPTDLTPWLESLDLGQYAEAFALNEITPELLPAITDEYLVALGMDDPEHRARLLAHIAALPTAHEETTTQAGAHPLAEPAPAAGGFDVNRKIEFTLPPPSSSRTSSAKPTVASPAPTGMPTPPPAPSHSPTVKRAGLFARLLTRKFLLISIAVHLLFGLAATYFIVQRVQAKRKITFQGGPPSTTASKRALEHKVSMAKKKKTGGAPPQAKRIVSAGLAKVSLPDLPTVPSAANVVPGMMAGMGGAGFGAGMGVGSGMGSGMGGGGGGGGMTMFGFHNASGGGLAGEFYDLKQTRGRRPSGVDNAKYGAIISQFIEKNWQESILNDYYKAPKALFAAQLLIPAIEASSAPKAFDVERQVQPTRWVALYKGDVVAPESGTFHFVGVGDDVLFVRFNGKNVLNGSWDSPSQFGPGVNDRFGIKIDERYRCEWPRPPHASHAGGFAKGGGFTVEAGKSYPIQILIGEWPGGMSHFVLLIEKDGGEYKRTPEGMPILPPFRTASVKDPKLENGQTLPPHLETGPIWRARAASGGTLLDAIRR
jgi:hypothetical protein